MAIVPTWRTCLPRLKREPDARTQNGTLNPELREKDVISTQPRSTPQKRLKKQAERIFFTTGFPDRKEQTGAEPKTDVKIASPLVRTADRANNPHYSDRAAQSTRYLDAALAAGKRGRAVNVENALYRVEARRRHVSSLDAYTGQCSDAHLQVPPPALLGKSLSCRQSKCDEENNQGDGVRAAHSFNRTPIAATFSRRLRAGGCPRHGTIKIPSD